MSHANQLLLINGSHDSQWHLLIEQVAQRFGSLTVSVGTAIEALLTETNFSVILIDASAVEQVPPLIRRIRALQPCARVVVATAAPSWQGARAAFMAGAFDYVIRSLCRSELANVIAAAIDAPPPPCR